MITTVRILDTQYQNRIGKTAIEFKPGINIVVGENGSGKSSLLNLIRSEVDTPTGTKARLIRDDHVPVKVYNAEEATMSRKDTAANSISDSAVSHGQRLARYLETLQNLKGEHVILADEIETAISFDAVWQLAEYLADAPSSVQWIITTHSPVLWKLPGVNIINLSREDDDYIGHRLERLANLLVNNSLTHVEPAIADDDEDDADESDKESSKKVSKKKSLKKKPVDEDEKPKKKKKSSKDKTEKSGKKGRLKF